MDSGDGMPNALTVDSTAARIELAWWNVHPQVCAAAIAAVFTSVAVAELLPVDAIERVGIGLSGTFLALAALVDAHEQRIPNRLLALATIAACSRPGLRLDGPMMSRQLIGFVLAGGALGLVRAIRGVGMGDVKMAAVVGAGVGSFGWRRALIAVAIAAAAGATFGAVTGRRRLALGPALWLGWAIAMWVSSTGWWT